MPSCTSTVRGTRSMAWLYAFTILISAFLVFQVQPIISKFILPWFGGSPAVWTTCMLFFQVVLFAGYAYAHLLTRLRPVWQSVVHLALIYLALVLLPITPDPKWKMTGTNEPTWTILLLLTTTVGLPYFLLSSTGPLVQSWFSRALPNASAYRLYALSNVGSLAALLSYPFIVEPAATVQMQATIWSLAFGLFGLCCGYCAVRVRRTGRGGVGSTSRDGEHLDEDGRPSERSTGARVSPRWRDCGLWLLLAAFASMMLLATTNHVCQDVAVVPFLWVAPLSLYLLSFIICFHNESWYWRRIYATGALVSIGTASVFTWLGYLPGLVAEVSIYFVALFCICMVCHGELVRRKPHPRYLTLFYLMCSAGGALGGVFVALVCPRLFSGYHEMNIGLVVGYLMAMTVALARSDGSSHTAHPQLRPVMALFGFAGLLCVVRGQASSVSDRGLIATRNFYGVLRLKEEQTDRPEREGRYLFHGRIAHGFQFREPSKRRVPTMYFDESSGLGVTLRNYPRTDAMRVGVIGLGAGTIATYGQPGDVYRFYEINPQVEQFARKYFTFIQDSRADVDVVLGDARLSMEQEPPQHFDVLVLDAFSGDAIPTHLLTKEAFQVYRRHLEPDGVIAANISNRHLDLAPVLVNLAHDQRMGFHSVVTRQDPEQFRAASHWFLMSHSRQFLENEAVVAAARGDLGHYVQIPLWTDQSNNLFQILK